nr:DoxX family protein [uncultured Rhodoferax sp.]
MKKLLLNFPFIGLPSALFIFRLALAAVFIGHATMRLVVPDYFATIGIFLEKNGVPFGFAVAWIVTIVELIGGPLMIFNRFVRWVALCFFAISVGTMAFVQSRVGWWVAEFGDGGMEFSFVVCAMCIFIATVGHQQQTPKVGEAPTAQHASSGSALKTFLNAFPQWTPSQGYGVLRLALAAFFMIHAVTRFTLDNYFQGLGKGLEHFGMPFGYALGILATTIELVGGTLLIFNKFAKWAALGFFGISAVGIAFIHLKLGWYVGEFGKGGAEFSVAICATCLLIAAYDRTHGGQSYASDRAT